MLVTPPVHEAALPVEVLDVDLALLHVIQRKSLRVRRRHEHTYLLYY